MFCNKQCKVLIEQEKERHDTCSTNRDGCFGWRRKRRTNNNDRSDKDDLGWFHEAELDSDGNPSDDIYNGTWWYEPCLHKDSE